MTFLAVVETEDVGSVTVPDCSGKPGAAGIFSMCAAPEVCDSEAAFELIEAAVAWAGSREYTPRNGGMTTHIGQLAPCPILGHKFTLSTHNTLRGAAAGNLLIAELLVAKGLLATG